MKSSASFSIPFIRSWKPLASFNLSKSLWRSSITTLACAGRESTSRPSGWIAYAHCFCHWDSSSSICSTWDLTSFNSSSCRFLSLMDCFLSFMSFPCSSIIFWLLLIRSVKVSPSSAGGSEMESRHWFNLSRCIWMLLFNSSALDIRPRSPENLSTMTLWSWVQARISFGDPGDIPFSSQSSFQTSWIFASSFSTSSSRFFQCSNLFFFVLKSAMSLAFLATRSASRLSRSANSSALWTLSS